MSKIFSRLSFPTPLFQLILLFLFLSQSNSQTVHNINQDVSGYTEYKKAEFSQESSFNYYFRHTVTFESKSKVTAFRFEFDQFDQIIKGSKIFCTMVESSTSDDQLRTLLDGLDETTTSCVGDFNEDDKGIYDGIIKLSETKKEIGIVLKLPAVINFNARIFLRISEENLEIVEQEKSIDQSLSLVPNTVVISDFRVYASKLLFYSYTRELQMYYIEGDVPYPEKIFSGNILLVYTNPNQVRQKYKNANTMVLLTRPFPKTEPEEEPFQLQVKFFASIDLLDYFVSNNPTGRSKNTPLMINMTECTSPYYVILNYNQKEKTMQLYIDQIYGKIKTLSVAPTFTKNYWESMITDDMQEISVSERYYELPGYQENHIDVYKVECEIPLLLNFYFIEEQASIPDLDYGHVAIVNLKASQTYTSPFALGVKSPILAIEVFNPIKSPLLIIDDGQNEAMITKNSLIKSTPISSFNPIVLRERSGESGTRVIIKVGYQIQGSDWVEKHENIYYNSKLNLFVFSFPNGEDKLNYTYADLLTIGTKEDDNIKYYFSSNIGSPILPSAENCFRVSLSNSYTLKVMNPLIIFKDYDFDNDIGYYVSIKPVVSTDIIDVTRTLYTYDTLERNLEGESNVVEINTERTGKTILTFPLNKDTDEFVQITQCQKSDIRFKLINAYFQNQTVIAETIIPSGTKNFFKTFTNILLETELTLTGNAGNKVFIRHSGISANYSPNIIENPSITFDSNTNQIILEHPLNTFFDRIEYTVYVGAEGVLSNKDITLCSIAEGELTSLYSKTVISYEETASISINFEKVGLKTGQTFEAIVYYEQKFFSKMAFLSSIFKGTVGEIKQDVITEINQEYSEDHDYVYSSGIFTNEGNSLYFSFMPSEIREVPVGAFRIELNNEFEKTISGISCAFVDEGETASGMIEAVEDNEALTNPYCIGGKSTTDGKNYNYIFRFSYTNDKKPRRLVIKVSNNQKIEDGFNIYIRKGENTYINSTDFSEQREYGKREEYQKTMMPYIIDLTLIRGDSTDNYISKLLIYSRYLEMQAYYLDETGETNKPILLFSGYIMLILTKPELALQKYHGTKLILLSENLYGQEHTILGNNFRFHTKMYKSADQIEYFQSNDANGRTRNVPLSLEINSCSSANNKYYYILNYNSIEDERILYLDLLYGKMNKARVIGTVNSFYWTNLINNDLIDITNLQITLGQNYQHADIVEIQCQTPLLVNAYYNTPDEKFLDLKKGNVAIKTLSPSQNTLITLDPLLTGRLYFAISLYNPTENPDMTFYYGTGYSETIKGNSLKITQLYNSPQNISVINNGNSNTRFILKIGFVVEFESDWYEEKTNLYGALFRNQNKYVYKFPYSYNKRNFTNVEFLVKPLKKDTEELSQNTKFCYSTSIGESIDVSKENCFRTGANIPYTLNFVNPLIAPKNYTTFEESDYYITIIPYDYTQYISLTITENKYDIEQRGIEGIPSVLNFGNKYEKGIILTIPQQNSINKIFIQLQACTAQNDNITYTNLDAYSKEIIYQGELHKNTKMFTYSIDNNKMETEMDFKGNLNDKVFVKHIGMNNVNIKLEEYSATWIESKNTVKIVKPIKNGEAFDITVLIAEKGHFNDYSLCTFVETPFDKYITLGDYVSTFVSVSSDIVVHYINFDNVPGYSIGEEFDLLVYAVQKYNTKLEVLYNVISGRVGKLEGIEEIVGTIPNKKEYTTQIFLQNAESNNYLFYNFDNEPTGDISSLKIFSDSKTGSPISKIICTFVPKSSSTGEMIEAVNNAEKNFNNLCVGAAYDDGTGYDALINSKNIKNEDTKLVILVKYGTAENRKIEEKLGDIITMNITIRTTGFLIDKEEYEYNENEELTLVPYVLDLKKIREMQTENYHSKVLIFSNTRELQMYYIQDSSPVELFSGNIMMVYTNEDVIREKYNGASTMILLTNSLTNKKPNPIGESFKFKVSFFNSAKTIQYYVSANKDGRPLNNPTSIEMLSCDQPYYYILNYNSIEGDRMLHLDTIFGEINSTKFANQLTSNSWDTFISEMGEFKGDEYIIKGQNKYHIDVFEVTCKTPLLLNVFYTDEANPKKYNLQQGDVSILKLGPNAKDSLTFIENLKGSRFFYSFTIHRTYGAPNILIEFDNANDNLEIKQNGIYVQNTIINYHSLTISNKQLSGDDSTKIYFKFGYNIDETFTKIENDIYNIQTEDRTDNIFVYMFKNGEDRLNYTKVNFTVSTTFDNVKFCYATNLGTFIYPSTQNCFRVGEKNSYTISIINPYNMYKNYFTGNDTMNYYISFKTENKDLNITILPQLIKYNTTNRNLPEIPSTLIINNKEEKTILTNPENKEFLFVQMEICSSNSSITYEFKNAFNGESLGNNGQINSGMKYNYKIMANTKLDTELILSSQNQDVNVFVKHTGLNQEFFPNVKTISIKYEDKKLIFNQPIDNEEFKYTILLDKKDNIKKQKYTICSFTQNRKMAYFTDYITSSAQEVSYPLDFEKDQRLKGYENFEILILAEEINNGKMVILSEIYSPNENDGKEETTNTALIVVIIILSLVLVIGGIILFLYLRRIKNRPKGAFDSKPTDMGEIDSADAGQKLVESMAQSQAAEKQ